MCFALDTYAVIRMLTHIAHYVATYKCRPRCDTYVLTNPVKSSCNQVYKNICLSIDVVNIFLNQCVVSKLGSFAAKSARSVLFNTPAMYDRMT